MMDNFFPYQIVRAVPYEEGLSFLKQDCRINIKSKDMTSNIWKILEHCDGEKSVSMIAELTNIDIETARGYINDLRTLGVLVDSRELFKEFHSISNFPAHFNHKISFNEIEEIQRRFPVEKRQQATY